MPKRNLFPDEEELSSLLQQARPRDALDYKQEELRQSLDNLAIEREVTKSMLGLMDLEKEEAELDLQQEAIRQSKSILPLIKALNPASDDYESLLTQAISENPYGAQDPAVQNILKLQGSTRSQVRQTRDRADEVSRQKAERDTAIRLNIAQQGGSDSLARFNKMVNEEGRDPSEAAAHVKSVNDSQELYSMLGKAGITDEAVIKTLKDEKTGLLDKFKVDVALADLKRSMIDDDQGKLAVKFVDALNKRRADGDEITKDEEDKYTVVKQLADDWMLQGARGRVPKTTPANGSAAPAASGTAKPGKPISTPDGKKVNFSVE